MNAETTKQATLGRRASFEQPSTRSGASVSQNYATHVVVKRIGCDDGFTSVTRAKSRAEADSAFERYCGSLTASGFAAK